MTDTIKDGGGSGRQAKVNKDNKLEVVSESESIQHSISDQKRQAYQCIGIATLAAATVVVLHIKNISSDKNLVLTYIRHQIIDNSGGTAFPNASNYFRIALNRTYSSGGSVTTPINVNAESGNAAEVTAFQAAPTLTGTANEIDRWYTKAEGDMNTFNKEGAVILRAGRTLELSYVGDQTGGTVYARISFLMQEIDHM